MALAPATSVFGLIGFSGRVGREIEQLAMLKPFEKHYADDWWYRTQLAFAQIELGEFEEGERNIDAALAAFPASAHAAHIRGHLFYELGEREAGLAFLTDWMRQSPDGSWVNPADRFMEGDPNLVTAYALLALSHARVKA